MIADSSGLDEELQSCVASRGMLHMFGSNRSTDKQESDESDCDAVSNSPQSMCQPSTFSFFKPFLHGWFAPFVVLEFKGCLLPLKALSGK